MSASQRTRRRSRQPLVMLTRRAREQAAELLPGKVVERVVADAIVEQGSTEGRPAWSGKTPFKVPGDGWCATVVRRPGKLRPRPRAWVVLDLQPSTVANATPVEIGSAS